MKINSENQPYIILFDGLCNLCNDAVQFIIRYDKQNRFVLASLQSNVAQKLLDKIQVKSSLETMVLIKANKHYEKSDAVLEIAKNLSGLWPMAYAFQIIPRLLRDVLDNWVAKNRYTWIGNSKSCVSTCPELRARFLD
jgi:predicted DCC family thiol-disulfide oxidoreductase YuxK